MYLLIEMVVGGFTNVFIVLIIDFQLITLHKYHMVKNVYFSWDGSCIN